MGLLVSAVRLYTFVIIVRVLFSWLPPRHRQNEIYAFLFRITEPVLGPFRRAMPPMGGVDFSPLIVIVILQVITGILRTS